MDEQRRVKLSKYLSYHLRHRPDALGIVLDSGGWVAVDILLAAAAQQGTTITRTELDEVVATNNKQRFAFDVSGTRIRANQGHSVAIDLQLAPSTPPPQLYHGTSHGTAAAIEREGLRKMRRHHVHLSPDVATARAVGARRGRPVIFAVAADAMSRDGYLFFRSANGVWLVDAVAPHYLHILSVDDE